MTTKLRYLWLFAILTQVGSADFLYPDSATTNGGEFSSDFAIDNLNNAGFRSKDEKEDAAAGASGRSYASANKPPGNYPVTITLEFDTPVSLDEFHLWNHSNKGVNSATNQGVKVFTLTFHDDSGGTGTQIGKLFVAEAVKAPVTGVYPAQTFKFGTTYKNVRSVVFKADNHRPSAAFVGIREIGFNGSAGPTQASTSTSKSTPDKVIVYLVGGQSNADGYGITSKLPAELREPQPDIDFYHSNAGGNSPLPAKQWIPLQPGSGSKPGNAGGFGPELSFGIAIRDALGSDGARIAIIKHALGGSNLHTDWFPGGDGTPKGDGPAYQAFQATVKNGLTALTERYPDATIQIGGMIWHQGESDANSAKSAGAYRTNLTDFIADLRATPGIGSDLKFGIVQISDSQTAINPESASTVKLAQAAVAEADPLNYLVGTDGLQVSGGKIHFGTAEVQTIGARLAAGMQQLHSTDSD